MRSCPKRNRGIGIPGLILILSLCLCCAQGCVRNSIQTARRESTNAYQDHLRAVPAADETPEQAAQTAALRQRVLHDEWLAWGYRFGNEKEGTVLYSAAGRGVVSFLWSPFKFVSQAWSYAFGGDRPVRAARLMEESNSADDRRRGI